MGHDSSNRVRQALVLAAGRGSRISHSDSKPLFPVLGVPLLARTLFTLEKGGITDAYVVLGYQGDRVRREIEKIERLGIRVHWIHNEHWEEPNGVSVLAAESALSGPFVLTMADHLFEADAVRRLGERLDDLDGLLLIVDRGTEAVNDPEDATKVELDGNRITDIGKSLTSFDAIDTGVFLASPQLFAALRAVEGPEGPSLSDGVRVLASEGKAGAVDGSDLMWQDVDTRSDAKVAAAKLMAMWPKDTDGPVARWINRPLSKRVTRLLVNTPVTPNHVSVATLLLGLVSALLAAVGGYWNWLASAALFQLASILDGTDGELAVLTFRSSELGAWIDTICDNLSYVAFLTGLTVGIYRADLHPFYFWGGIIGIVATALSLANINLYLIREGKSGSALNMPYAYKTGTSAFAKVLQLVHFLGKRDLLAFLVLTLAVIGQLPLGLPMFGLGVTLLLLPATTKANVTLFLRTRRMASADGGMKD